MSSETAGIPRPSTAIEISIAWVRRAAEMRTIRVRPEDLTEDEVIAVARWLWRNGGEAAMRADAARRINAMLS
jgi:hypothetical protein